MRDGRSGWPFGDAGASATVGLICETGDEFTVHNTHPRDVAMPMPGMSVPVRRCSSYLNVIGELTRGAVLVNLPATLIFFRVSRVRAAVLTSDLYAPLVVIVTENVLLAFFMIFA